MSLTHTTTRTYKGTDAASIILVETPAGNAEFNLDQAVPIAANTQYHIALTRANIVSLCLYSDQAITIFTNNPSGSSPTDTIALVAGQNRLWTLATDLIARCPFTADVTTLYITNASASVANVKIRALLNQ